MAKPGTQTHEGRRNPPHPIQTRVGSKPPRAGGGVNRDHMRGENRFPGSGALRPPAEMGRPAGDDGMPETFSTPRTRIGQKHDPRAGHR